MNKCSKHSTILQYNGSDGATGNVIYLDRHKVGEKCKKDEVLTQFQLKTPNKGDPNWDIQYDYTCCKVEDYGDF